MKRIFAVDEVRGGLGPGGQVWRFRSAEIALATLALLIIAQAVRIQFSPQASIFEDQGKTFQGEYHTVFPPRGQILDRWGRVLGGNKTVYEIGVNLRDVENPETIALTLMGVVQADYTRVLGLASQEYDAEPPDMAVYAMLADYVAEEQVLHIQKLAEDMAKQSRPRDADVKLPSLRGLVFRAHPARSYPEQELASNILGFVTRDGEGFFGVEEKFNDLLAGTPQTVWVPLDPTQVTETSEVPPGADLILTIDRDIQASMEEILDRAIANSGSNSGSLLVMDPTSGEILAMASAPRMDLNKFWEFGDIYPGQTPFNRGIAEYEPGSVFKVLTMAAALDAGAVKPGTEFLDTGVFEIGGIYIHNWNSGAWGPQTMLGCLQHSLNVCLAWVASELGNARFYQYMQNFGIGHLTGVDLAGELPGRLKLPGDEDWYEADLGTNSFGQGVSVTPVQMLMAISAVANQGRMMAPHVVRSMVNNGHQYNISPQVVGIPISMKTARQLTGMLATSLEVESSDALVEGYRVAGKTGTAEIATPTGYTGTQTNASFVGWGPVDDPRFLVYVWLEKPSTSPWGSVVASPVFKEAVERLVILMDIPPDNVRQRFEKTNSQ
jgi:cell division protein FtsI/penicillin-binding protein 2